MGGLPVITNDGEETGPVRGEGAHKLAGVEDLSRERGDVVDDGADACVVDVWVGGGDKGGGEVRDVGGDGREKVWL